MSASRKISTQMAERRDTYNQVQEITARISRPLRPPAERPGPLEALGRSLRAPVDNRLPHVDGIRPGCALAPRDSWGNHRRPAGSTEPLSCSSTSRTRVVSGRSGLIPRIHIS